MIKNNTLATPTQKYPDSALAEARDSLPPTGQYSPKHKYPLKDKDHLLYNLLCSLEPFIVSFLPNINRPQFSGNDY